MALTHIGFDKTTPHGNLLYNHLNKMEQAFDGLNDIRGTMELMIDGDGSDASHFTYMTAKFGFESNAVAKSAFEELSSVLGKLNTDAEVTFVNAAMLQVFAKFR
jgi:hypothetical protein